MATQNLVCVHCKTPLIEYLDPLVSLRDAICFLYTNQQGQLGLALRPASDSQSSPNPTEHLQYTIHRAGFFKLLVKMEENEKKKNKKFSPYIAKCGFCDVKVASWCRSFDNGDLALLFSFDGVVLKPLESLNDIKPNKGTWSKFLESNPMALLEAKSIVDFFNSDGSIGQKLDTCVSTLTVREKTSKSV